MVIASAAAVAQKTIGREALEDSVQTLNPGLRVDLEEMVDSWRRMGYRVEPTVDVPGLVGPARRDRRHIPRRLRSAPPALSCGATRSTRYANSTLRPSARRTWSTR